MSLIDLIKDKEMIFVTGKGGVGKSTLSAALSLYFMQTNPVLAIDIDPAHSLPDVFGIDAKHNVPEIIFNNPNQLSLLLNTPKQIIDKVYENSKKELKNRAEGLPTYQIVMHLYSVVRQLGFPIAMKDFASLNTTVNEIALAIKNNQNTKIIGDLEPSNATLELLDDAKYCVERLRVMADHKGKISYVARLSKWRDIENFVKNKDFTNQVKEYADIFASFNNMIRDSEKTSFIIMSEPTPVVLKETTRLRNELEELNLNVSAIVFNKDYQNINNKNLKGTILEHWPVHHRYNTGSYIRQNTSFKGRYFSIPPLDIGIATTQKSKIENLKLLLDSVKSI